ncbi:MULTISPECIES: hypothetical protein [unclassified Leptolyngbya]|uniref:hypothetical protein n=1 Tax=unclassified Leptolyngbya TaxID=2650499 RepID=UPI001682E9CB|nr:MULTISPECIES: hypothetical protein [unclassified Leptolyngbya]MBD1913118.1 hypothetical protein [Leptolyngbya sp. FACHB-8]MBD2157814.1 hypothetical protein [Leptolyngbya sp. FACHB-16]
MNITGMNGLTEAQKATLKVLGAIASVASKLSRLCNNKESVAMPHSLFVSVDLAIALTKA